jgi:hypothetical protein
VPGNTVRRRPGEHRRGEDCDDGRQRRLVLVVGRRAVEVTHPQAVADTPQNGIQGKEAVAGEPLDLVARVDVVAGLVGPGLVVLDAIGRGRAIVGLRRKAFIGGRG